MHLPIIYLLPISSSSFPSASEQGNPLAQPPDVSSSASPFISIIYYGSLLVPKIAAWAGLVMQDELFSDTDILKLKRNIFNQHVGKD